MIDTNYIETEQVQTRAAKNAQSAEIARLTKIFLKKHKITIGEPLKRTVEDYQMANSKRHNIYQQMNKQLQQQKAER